MSGPPVDQLTDFERNAFRLFRVANETTMGRRLQSTWINRAVFPLVRTAIARQIYVVIPEWMNDHKPTTGTLLCGNHRSFFDQFLTLLTLWNWQPRWFSSIHFPVRSNYFYDSYGGVALNLALGAGSMYPPIFREREKADFNRYSVDRVVELLRDPTALVGVHPEGKRGTGPSPYELLRAQPGVGQMVLRAQPLVIPSFATGITNDFVGMIAASLNRDVRRDKPVIVVFGDPVDYTEFLSDTPRAALYLKCAARIRDRIIGLMDIEREVRARCEAGEMPDDDPGWLV